MSFFEPGKRARGKNKQIPTWSTCASRFSPYLSSSLFLEWNRPEIRNTSKLLSLEAMNILNMDNRTKRQWYVVLLFIYLFIIYLFGQAKLYKLVFWMCNGVQWCMHRFSIQVNSQSIWPSLSVYIIIQTVKRAVLLFNHRIFRPLKEQCWHSANYI